jgi:hypothetical protein
MKKDQWTTIGRISEAIAAITGFIHERGGRPAALGRPSRERHK